MRLHAHRPGCPQFDPKRLNLRASDFQDGHVIEWRGHILSWSSRQRAYMVELAGPVQQPPHIQFTALKCALGFIYQVDEAKVLA